MERQAFCRYVNWQLAYPLEREFVLAMQLHLFLHVLLVDLGGVLGVHYPCLETRDELVTLSAVSLQLLDVGPVLNAHGLRVRKSTCILTLQTCSMFDYI